MSILLVIYIVFSIPILYHDIRYQNIPDKYSISAIILIFISMIYFEYNIINALIAAVFIFTVFLIPIIFGMDFGGGDIRYGVLSAFVVGFPDIAYWLVLSCVLHLIILLIIRKQIFGFAPAMFIATILLPFLPFLHLG